jgi:hypothetical protein
VSFSLHSPIHQLVSPRASVAASLTPTLCRATRSRVLPGCPPRGQPCSRSHQVGAAVRACCRLCSSRRHCAPLRPTGRLSTSRKPKLTAPVCLHPASRPPSAQPFVSEPTPLHHLAAAADELILASPPPSPPSSPTVELLLRVPWPETKTKIPDQIWGRPRSGPPRLYCQAAATPLPLCRRPNAE